MKRELLLAVLVGLVLPANAQNSVIAWASVGSSGAAMSGGNVGVISSFGQAFEGSTVFSNVAVQAGFLANTKFSGSPSSLAENPWLPSTISLSQNYPNPFNPSTTITYELPNPSDVRLSVYDVLGREIAVLVNEKRNAGMHEAKFEAVGLASGVYFYGMQAGDFVATKRLLLVR